jgi:hypothetical protein
MNLVRSSAVLLLLASACATGGEDVRSDGPRPGGCALVELKWAAAPADFNRELTAATLRRLADAARADHEQWKSEPTGRALGERLAAVDRETQGAVFVSDAALQSAMRLRQLECAIQRGTFAAHPETVDRLYGEIVAEVDAEGQTLAKLGR